MAIGQRKLNSCRDCLLPRCRQTFVVAVTFHCCLAPCSAFWLRQALRTGGSRSTPQLPVELSGVPVKAWSYPVGCKSTVLAKTQIRDSLMLSQYPAPSTSSVSVSNPICLSVAPSLFLSAASPQLHCLPQEALQKNLFIPSVLCNLYLCFLIEMFQDNSYFLSAQQLKK